jgi:hypothetical protein
VTDKSNGEPVEDKITTPVPTPDNSGQNKGDQLSESAASKEVRERIVRAKRKEREELLSKLEAKDLEEAVALLTEARQIKQGQMSELQKVQAVADKEKKDREKLENDLAALRAERATENRDGALEQAARDAKAEKPEYILMWAEKFAAADLAALVDEDGKVDDKAVADLIKKVQTAEPKWFGAGGPGSPSNRGGKTPDAQTQLAQALKGKKLFNF